MGKTSVDSRLNIPGKIGWMTMEVPGFLILLYIMYTLPAKLGIQSLPWENYTMAALFVSRSIYSTSTDQLPHTNITMQTIHYLYRAILSPLISPSMSPIHIINWSGAFLFQIFNGISIGGWLGGYGPTTRADWAGHQNNYVAGARMEFGLVLWAIGFFLTIFHDDELREIRRAAARNQQRRAAQAEHSTGKDKMANGSTGVDKVYMIPKNGLFWWIFYPHYLCEWMEWTGFWVAGGSKCLPARTFLVNEISTMLPRAIQGKKWYIERFGEYKVAGRKAIIPKLL